MYVIRKNIFVTQGLFIWGEWAQLGGLALLGEMIFISRSYGIFCLTLIKNFVMSLEKDCFGHVVFKRKFFYFQWSFQKVVAIRFCCIKYFATSWNFACMVRNQKNLYKKITRNLQKIRVFQGSIAFVRTVFYYPTLPGWPTCACSNEKFSSNLSGIPAISSEIPPRCTGSLLVWTCFVSLGVS